MVVRVSGLLPITERMDVVFHRPFGSEQLPTKRNFAVDFEVQPQPSEELAHFITLFLDGAGCVNLARVAVERVETGCYSLSFVHISFSFVICNLG